MSFLQHIQWLAVGQIILIDILLGGDNAVVIALACRNLPEKQRWKGIIWGTLGAIILRVVLVAFAVTLLQIPALKIIGGALLFWIGIKLLLPQDDDEHGSMQAHTHLIGAIKTIIIADLVMSIDNVIAIAGAAQTAAADHQIYSVVFGLVVSIPFIVFGSQLILKLIDRFPIIVTLGAALLGFIAGELMVTDPLTQPYFADHLNAWKYSAGAAGAVLVVLMAKWLTPRQRPV
ncbi:MAG: TerC family protein [Burkholderiales bacterium]